MITSNPFSSVKAPRVQPVEQTVLNEDESQRLLTAAESTPLYPLVVTAIATGARVGELAAPAWRYVDLDAGRITIAYTQAKDGSRSEPKTRRSRRTIALPPFALSVLKAHKARQKLSTGKEWSEDRSVFRDRFGKGIRVADISGEFKPIAQQAGLDEKVHPHSLRHTYASLALKAGVPVTTVSAYLGHSNTATTLNVYAHHIPSTEDMAASAIQRAIGGNQ